MADDISNEMQENKRSGFFITLEGPDCAGKTTHMENIKSWLEIEHGFNVLTCREPGGTVIGEELRRLLKTVDGENQASEIAELLMFSASRRQLLDKVILPHLGTGGVVLCDRFLDSTTAYQGYGRGINLSDIYRAHGIAVGDNLPDLTILLDVDPSERLYRKALRDGKEPEKCNFENEAQKFHNDVRYGYLDIAAQHPDRIKVVESERGIEKTWQNVLKVLKEFFNEL